MLNIKVPSFNVKAYPFSDGSNETKELLRIAIDARSKGDQTISNFSVGSAIEVDGCKSKIYIGANCENPNFNGSSHSEQVAITSALMDRESKEKPIVIKSIAIAGGMSSVNFDKVEQLTQAELTQILHVGVSAGKQPIENILEGGAITPCGHCRQIICQYSDALTKLYLINPSGIVLEMPFDPILPFAFKKIG